MVILRASLETKIAFLTFTMFDEINMVLEHGIFVLFLAAHNVELDF